MPYDRRRIALASGVMPEFTPVRTVEAAAHAGFDETGVWVDLRTWTDATTRDVRRALDAAGLRPVDVEVLRIRPGPLEPRHLRMLEIGAELGAPNALIVSHDPDVAATTAKYAAICERAAALGTRASLEFGLFTEVKTIDAALTIVRAVESPAAALLVDPLHLARSGGMPADVARVAPERLAYAQFCDAAADGPGADDPEGVIAEAVDGRLPCGDGALPLRELLDALPERLVLSVELRSKALREAYPDAFERAAAVASTTRTFLRRLDEAAARDAR